MSRPPIPPEGRAEVLRVARNLKMAGSQHAYVRGSTVKFYEWLDASAGKLPAGPSVWICGDCHVGNLGPLADAEGRVEIQIRDLDQTVIGNPAHDLIRLGLSLASMSRGMDLPGVTVSRMMEEITDGYAQTLSEGRDGQTEAERPVSVQTLLKHAGKRRWKHLAQERLQDVKPSIPLGKRFWALTSDERAGLEAMLDDKATHARIAGWKGLEPSDAPTLLDAAYWMKGCSSLGRLRYAVLIGSKERNNGAPSLIDVKEGVKAAAPCDPATNMPRDHAERVVAGARALSPNLGERMIAGGLLGKSVVVRELTPQDLKFDIDQLSQIEAMQIARYLAGVVGLAHGRQMSADVRRAWVRDLARSRSKAMDAPTWLWSSVVELVSVHEAAYLEHCRRYALAEAA